MRKILKSIFWGLLSVSIIIFLFIIIKLIGSTPKEYQYAIIGATGSIIGGSLTLAGVWWTLNNQSKSKFIDEFPRKISNLDQLKKNIIRINESENLFKDIFYPNQSEAYKKFVDNLKLDTTEVDGTSYFIVCKLDNLYEEFNNRRNEIVEYEEDVFGTFGEPIQTTQSYNRLLELVNEFKSKLNNIVEELELHGNELTYTFFKYKGKK